MPVANKKLIVYLLTFITLYFIGFYFHENYIENKVILLPFSLQKIYLFHSGFSLMVCVNLLLLSSVNKIADQLGFIYLGTILLKLLLFSIIFYKSIITNEILEFSARISLIIPLLIFLLTEAFFVIQILIEKE
jgi:hypothetical protein